MIWVPTAKVDLDAYRASIGDELALEIESLAGQVKGLRAIHLNGTPAGGGVAEILRSLVPLLKGLGVEAEWHVVSPDDGFFEVTKKIHNLLQGKAGSLTETERLVYLEHARQTAQEAKRLGADVWVIDDPQPMPIVGFDEGLHPAVWRCHIDTSQPNPEVSSFLLPYLQRYDEFIFTLPDYVFPSIDQAKVNFFFPALDPLTAKNAPLDRGFAKRVLQKLGIAPDRPLVTQVSRFDPWKDPIGVVEAYRLVKKEMPELQLALVGTMKALDDPEAVRILAAVQGQAAGDPDIHLYSDANQVGDLEVNAFQTASAVIVQKSIREGFGLTVTEAMWKGTPVVGGNVAGIRAQICDGENGFLVDSVEECADRILTLLQDPVLAHQMGQAGQESVRRRFLIPVLLRDHLRLLVRLASSNLSSLGLSQVREIEDLGKAA